MYIILKDFLQFFNVLNINNEHISKSFDYC
jgi:hypothetical protein